MPYRAKGRRAWQMDVSDHRGRVKKGCSTGTDDPARADAVHDAVTRWRAQPGLTSTGRGILAAIVEGRVSLGEAYDHEEAGTLGALLTRLDAAQAAAAAAAAVVDLDPLVARWAATGARPAAVREVRRFIPAGQVFPVQDFRRKRLAAFLDGLTADKRRRPDRAHLAKPATGATKNRHRAALSAFAKWLIVQEVLEVNPVREVPGYAERDELPVALTRAEWERVLAGYPTDPMLRAAAVLMGHGIEWGALPKIRKGHVDTGHGTVPTVHVHPAGGAKGKTRFRTRPVRLTEGWLLPPLGAYLRTLPHAGDLLFPGDEKKLYERLADAHADALVTAGVPRFTLHGWRHVYAITALKRGDDHQAVRRNLGHSPRSTLLYRTYAAYLPDAAPAPRAD